MTDTIFFRLLDGVSRPSRLSGAIEELRETGKATDAYSAELNSLCQVPGSPLAYWVNDRIRRLFQASTRTCRASASGASLKEISTPDHTLTPDRYVGDEAAEEDTEPFDVKVRRLTTQLRDQQSEARRLDAAIEANLETLGYTINEQTPFR